MTDSCRSICNYYDSKSKDQFLQNKIPGKFCSTCDKYLISKYLRCPCCHNEFEGVYYDVKTH